MMQATPHNAFNPFNKARVVGPAVALCFPRNKPPTSNTITTQPSLPLHEAAFRDHPSDTNLQTLLLYMQPLP
ncbi:hypothetical protein XA68_11173 [Ophiocordyceps unilateralis]|uniref:Uncharacterized protein n=1 Tax=Ophiocordyceps unilateralis TaxID=268505 RepID=A0A2A9PHD3_OPHUN|nr:hypothetical protein XA68_11173 [Ophiocordyceps unilateralis]